MRERLTDAANRLRLSGPWQDRSFERRLVWLLGSPRSGSTWLLRVLAEHAAVVPVDEPLIGLYLSPFLSDLPGSDPAALDVSNFTIRRVQAEKRSQFFSERYSRVWIPGLGRLLRDRLRAEAADCDSPVPPARRVVVVKEPNGSQSADILARCLPAARLLFLLRDGRDVVDSELAANLEGSWVTREFPGLVGIEEAQRLGFVIQSARKWLWRTEVVQEALRHHRGPSRVVRYEDLVADPPSVLSGLFRWLSLPAGTDELAAWVERNTFERLAAGQTGPAHFFRSATPGAWRENLRPDEAAAVQEILGPKLLELGYSSE